VKRSVTLILLLFELLLSPAVAQKKKKKNNEEDGLYPPVILDDTKKKKTEPTQSLPPPRELPTAVAGETDRLIFQVSPLSARGLLTQQTRDALRALQHSAHGATILKLRAFVAGSGDMRRIAEIIGEQWSDRRSALPALTVIQTGGLPMEGAQIVIESIAEEHKSVNPNGLAFVSGQRADNLDQAMAKVQNAVPYVQAADFVRITCFVRSLDENKDALPAMARHFPNAALNYVQAQREYVGPGAECEGVAHPSAAANGPASPGQTAVTTAPRLVLSAAQLGFGSQDGDVRLAFDRLEKSLAPLNAQLKSAVSTHVYLLSPGLREKIRAVHPELFQSNASTFVQVEALPSLDASFGVDVVAAADSSKTALASPVRENR
jgi:enamine deaminase RidA (YjgF/YER057c/UK114 family)